MAPEILEKKQKSTKSDVYDFGVLLIQLLNGSPFIVDGNEVHIRNFIQWVRKDHVKENGFQQIFNVVSHNSIIGFVKLESLFQNLKHSLLKLKFCGFQKRPPLKILQTIYILKCNLKFIIVWIPRIKFNN
jgi:hypothetical protein